MELFATVSVNGLEGQFDLPWSKVAEMKRNLHSPSEAYLDLYATGHPCPGWSQIAEILRGVGLPHEAVTVESNYVQGRERYMCTIMVFIGGLRSEGGIVFLSRVHAQGIKQSVLSVCLSVCLSICHNKNHQI
jgi:hypothetical protein